jgi:hypothetical protein
MPFTIYIKTDNAAFSDGNAGHETARILRALADRLDVYAPITQSGSARDVNGNEAGEWSYIEAAQ